MVQRDRYIVSLKREEERLEKRLKKLEMKQKEMRQKKHTLFETRLRLAGASWWAIPFVRGVSSRGVGSALTTSG